ncbi:Uncharacterized protein HDU89_004691 [Geranomyces variabilis]|nr:Uncharacterized protein HDU89_004691 [Geranomyces variabilis]
MSVGRVPSAITSDDTRREFGHKAVGYGQGVQTATGITTHETLLRGTFPSELHRISAIRIERGIYAIAERFLDILSGSDSMLFDGAPNVGKTTLLGDICNFLAEKVWPKLLNLLDSPELEGGGGVPHQCLGRTRVFGGLGWEENLEGCLKRSCETTPRPSLLRTS